MTLTGRQPPCAFPPHPGEEDPGALPEVTVKPRPSLARWVRHAPAQRAPAVAIPVVWPAAEIMHAAGLPGVWPGAGTVIAAALAGWAAERRGAGSGHPRMTAAEVAAATAVAGGWVTAADILGPLAGHPPWLTLAYLAGSAGGYAWLRTHHAVRAARARRDQAAADAAAWRAKKAWWHSVAHRIGLGRFHLQEASPTLLGEELLITTSPDGDLASRIAANSSAIAERLAHLLGLPYGRIDVNRTDYPGQLLISIRHKAPTVSGPVRHPMIDPASPYAAWFPVPATIRGPVPAGVIPETGLPMEVVLWDEDQGGKAIGVYAATGGGKTTMLNVIRERVTAMPDAVLIQLNGAKAGDELAWEPLAAATAAGSARFDEGAAEKILAVLEWVQLLITERSRTHVVTGDSVFQPTPEDPAVVVMIDEVDEVAKIPGASACLEFLASKQRSEAVSLILSGQRATQQWTGGGGVRANLSLAVTGRMARGSESRHVSGAEYDIPDISEYSRGEAGFFQLWDPRAKRITARGRGFDIGKIRDQQKIIASRDPRERPALPGPDLVLDDPGEHQDRAPGNGAPGAEGMRAMIAAARGEVTGNTPVPGTGPSAGNSAPGNVPGVPARTAFPAIRGVPSEAVAVLWPLLASGRTSAASAGLALGISKSAAHRYLAAMRDHGYAETTGSGPSAGWRLTVRTQAPGPEPAPQQYVTVADLADAVTKGLVEEVDDDARQLLEQVHGLLRRQRLTLVKEDRQ